MADSKAKIAVIRRINNMAAGNFGDHKPLRDGVSELRIDTGPGYRVYYARHGNTLYLLLTGGSKGKQSADIDKACKLWGDWKQRGEN